MLPWRPHVYPFLLPWPNLTWQKLIHEARHAWRTWSICLTLVFLFSLPTHSSTQFLQHCPTQLSSTRKTHYSVGMSEFRLFFLSSWSNSMFIVIVLSLLLIIIRDMKTQAQNEIWFKVTGLNTSSIWNTSQWLVNLFHNLRASKTPEGLHGGCSDLGVFIWDKLIPSICLHEYFSFFYDDLYYS